MSEQPQDPATNQQTTPDELDSTLDALIERLLTGSNGDAECGSVVEVELTEIDVLVDLSGAAIAPTQRVVNEESLRAAEDVANAKALENPLNPDASVRDAIEVKGLTPHIIDAVGPDLEKLADCARKARAEIKELTEKTALTPEALQTKKIESGLDPESARLRFYKAAVEYYEFNKHDLLRAAALGIAFYLNAQDAVVGICLTVLFFPLPKVSKK